MIKSNSEPISYQKWEDYPVYDGSDLGATYTTEKTTLRVWAPTAESLKIRLYENGAGGVIVREEPFRKDVQGTWLCILERNWKNYYYTLCANINGQWQKEVADPYSRAVGINGRRSMIIDLAGTNPDGWNEDVSPSLQCFSDIIIWEVHLRDFSIHASSGIKNAGKYLAFTEIGTVSPNGLRTGIDHIRELGVTHIHLLPVFDFAAIDETKLYEPQYNWGYDPLNYNVPEGSYATDPWNGKVRITEFKQMVQSMHRAGLRVIMDVVYNHVHNAAESHFEQLVPGYYFRTNPDGSFSNGSGCGNETASERPMMRKYIVESLKYWVTEYHIDGFRFDLMGLHDIETMNLIREELDMIDPGIFLYGEGWTGGESPLPNEIRAVKSHVRHLNGIAVFSDDIRDAIRGNWAQSDDAGFMAGKGGLADSIRFGVIASTQHPQINYNKVNYSKLPWAVSPMQTITYVTCHDNSCLWDKIVNTCKSCSHQDKLDIQKLANAITLTSQGIPFLHAGEEIVRTKYGEHNTYNLPDSFNQLIWTNKALYYDVFAHYRDMIALRKNHPAFRMTSSEMITKHLAFIETGNELLVGFKIADYGNNDTWKEIIVYYNAGASQVMRQLPGGGWRVVANKYEVNENGVRNQGYGGIIRNKILIPARSVMILVDERSIKP